MNATFTGVHIHDTLLSNWSAEQGAREKAELEDLTSRLESGMLMAYDDYHALSDNPEALDAVLACANLRLRLLEHSSDHFHSRNPALWTGEAIFGVVSLMIRDFALPAERLSAMTARMSRVPEFLHTMRARVVQPVPERWRDRAVRECSAAEELLGRGLEGWIAEHFAGNAESGAASNLALVRDAARQAREAFAEAQVWLGDCAIADTRSYAIGEPQFSEILKHGHFCNETPGALLRRAERELQHERERLARTLNDRYEQALDAEGELATSGSTPLKLSSGSDPLNDPLRLWPHAQAAIAADHPTTGEYYETFARRWQEIHDAVVAHDAVAWPHWPIRYVPIPMWAQEAAPHLYWLFYRSPAPFDEYRTYEYVVTPIDQTMLPDEQAKRLSAWNHSAITLNHVVHHGGVGHHIQNWNATHRSSSRVGTVAAVDCASRIGMFLGGSMAEGWACYATELVEELGLLSPLETVSEQHTRVRQLARAVVDIRLHTNDWSFAECAQYYVQQTSMSVDMAYAETTKNSMFPGTALMYWLGTQGILDLRERMQTALGEQFNLRTFHDELLGRGSIPVALAAKLMLSKLDHV